MTAVVADPAEPSGRLIGASLTSAVGSLPLHLLPLTIAAAVAGTDTSPEVAGLIASALLVGQLIASTLLPVLGVSTISKLWAAVLSVALLGGMVVSGLGGVVGLLGGWFLVGLSCGGLIFLGTVAAAHFRAPELAFTLRLGIVLVVAGACTVLVQVTGVLADYHGYLIWLAVAIAAILGIGNLLYAPASPLLSVGEPGTAAAFNAPLALGLAAAFVLFVGQTGLVAYVLFGAAERGMELRHAAWAFAACKIGSGIWLVAASQTSKPGSSIRRMALLGVLVAAGGYGISSAGHIAFLFASLILFQIAFNSLSAQMQGSIAATGPHVAGRWITCSLLLGAAVGPPLHGWAISAGLEAGFVAFALSTTALPVLWRIVCRTD
ncbi:MAG: hypothetical protein NXI18_06495 [Alphaproteobacteria bacterium]|nr:hypothetical protein [Alphaproteobacteria bacterium]